MGIMAEKQYAVHAKSITNTLGLQDYVPKCGKVEIVRCNHCRKIFLYKCSECGFTGPN